MPEWLFCILGPLLTFGVAITIFMVAGAAVEFVIGPFTDWLDEISDDR
jgi:hypothetical protein